MQKQHDPCPDCKEELEHTFGQSSGEWEIAYQIHNLGHTMQDLEKTLKKILDQFGALK